MPARRAARPIRTMAKAAEQRWRLLGQFLGQTAEAILITDARSRIVYANR